MRLTSGFIHNPRAGTGPAQRTNAKAPAGTRAARSLCHPAETAGTGLVLLILVFFLAGLVLGGYWYASSAKRGGRGAVLSPNTPLSEATQSVLSRLNGPIEVHFYALLDPASAPEPLRAFATRVGEKLAQYSQAAEGKFILTRRDTMTDENAQRASAEGIKAFNRDKGDACFLGVVLAKGGRTETLPALTPEWESAFESDLTRAIARLLEGTPAAQPAPTAPQANTATIEAVKRLVPNYTNVSSAEGARLIRDAAFKEYQAAANELAAKVKEAQERVAQAQKSGTEEERQAALKALRELRSAQTDKLQEIAIRSETQVQALEQLKGNSR